MPRSTSTGKLKGRVVQVDTIEEHDFGRLVTGLRALWDLTTGDPRIRVAILDGPVDAQHPCFSRASLIQLNTLVRAGAGNDAASRHGTHVASILFGQHGTAVSGVAPGCTGLIAPIYSPSGGDVLICSQLDLARAVNQAAAAGAHIINISGGEPVTHGSAAPILFDAIRRCQERGILIVAATGNEGCRCLHVPAALPSVLAVGAMNGQGGPLDFSNWGDAYRAQGVLAPGESIPGAIPGGGLAVGTGTSFAAPIVTGIAALLMSVMIERGQRPDATQVRDAILNSADPCPGGSSDCRRFLAGKLNVISALKRLGISLHRQSYVPAVRAASYKTQNISNYHQIRDIMSDTNSSQTLTASAPPETNIETATPGACEISSASQRVVTPQAGVQASGCGCGGKPDAPQIAYALGQVGYDFGLEARRDSFLQTSQKNVLDPMEMLNYLQENPSAAGSLVWTLSLDTTPIYAILPSGPFAATGYERLRELLRSQLAEGAERVSIPGLIRGSMTLMSGQTVPVLIPEIRGMYSWTTGMLVKAILGAPPEANKEAKAYGDKASGIQNFLERIYYELRNLGATSQERAINYAATNAFQLIFVYGDAIKSDLKLDTIEVERSPICRPGADCWDVKLVFFHPARRMEQARRVYRFTVDVSDVVPVTVGKVRSWDVY